MKVGDDEWSRCLEMPQFSSSVPAVCSLGLSVVWIARSQDNELYRNGEMFSEEQSLKEQ